MTRFTWDPFKEFINIQKHGVTFATAARAFSDPNRRIFIDAKHACWEPRLICIGEVDGKILTVRYVHREGLIRIFGAGYWRKGRQYYEEKKIE